VFKDTQSALKHIVKNKPDVVLVDIGAEPEQNKVIFQSIAEAMQYLKEIPYYIALSYDTSFAIHAIQAGFSDYLSLPISIHELGKSLFKFEKRIPEKTLKNLCIKSYSDYHFINIQDIVYLKADNNTTDIQLINGKIVTAYKTLKHFESALPFFFVRIHKSYIVNMNHVSRIHFSKSKCYLNYNEIVPFSISYRENIDFILQRIDQ